MYPGGSMFKNIIEGLKKTRNTLNSGIDSILTSFTKVDDELFDELEEILIMCDTGVKTAAELIIRVKKTAKEKRVTNPVEIRSLLKTEMVNILSGDNSLINSDNGLAIFVVLGVNGTGKTTTAGKLAFNLRKGKKQVTLAAADTFRAAAAEQLEIWAKRADCPIIRHKEGADPASVVFDALHAAKSRRSDYLICDTAGRLHTKKNLMEELKKLLRIIEREAPESPVETLLVLDATTGQNAIAQAKTFKEAVNITGIALTKLDGTAKGGVVLSVKNELGIPVKLIGVGEKLDDLQPFYAHDFVNALIE